MYDFEDSIFIPSRESNDGINAFSHRNIDTKIFFTTSQVVPIFKYLQMEGQIHFQQTEALSHSNCVATVRKV